MRSVGLAFGSQGYLYSTDMVDNEIWVINPAGGYSSASVFARGLTTPRGLAFDSTGNLYEADSGNGRIYEFTSVTPDGYGTRITFASGLSGPSFLAFQPALIPEPSTWAMLGLGAAALLIFSRRK
jgi:DNA-binding beta-propeller fold protein YncE